MKRFGTFDLGAFARAVGRDGAHERLAGMIRRLISLHSLHTDLESAADALRALAALSAAPARPDDRERLTLESALLENAIVLYARATKSTSRERAGFDIRSRLSPAERQAHAEICDLRDEAVAHFGSGGSYRGQWKAKAAVFQMEEDGFRIGVVARRLAFDRDLLERMEAQIGRARAILGQAYEAQLDLLTTEFARLLDMDMPFARRLRDHPLDLAAWLGSPRLAGEVLARQRHKGTIFRHRHRARE